MSRYYRQALSEKWLLWLKQQKLADFDAWWSLELEPVDGSNIDRGGWSTVYKFTRDGRAFYVKKQANHLSRSLASWFRLVPTFQAEYEQIERYQQASIPALDAVFFSTRKFNDEYQAVLVTESLEKYVAFDEIFVGTLSFGQRIKICQAVGQAIAKLHAAGIEHYNMYPKHIYIDVNVTPMMVRFIDLETSRKLFGIGNRRLRDIETLLRRSVSLNRADKLRILLGYFDRHRVDDSVKNAIAYIQKRSAKKMLRQG